jgi:hypothetical protein
VKHDRLLFPMGREVAYIASWSAVGGICAYVVWAFVDWLRPDLRPDAGEWMQIGAGLAGAAALAWVLAEAALH